MVADALAAAILGGFFRSPQWHFFRDARAPAVPACRVD
jgi:hypothetical protein